MIVNVVGAARGSFKNDAEQQQQYAQVYVLESLKGDTTRDLEAVGMKADKYSATPEAFSAIKGAKLPSKFVCEVETRQTAQGMKIKLLTAEAFGAPVKP
jgi:hypothetical protein